MNAVVSQDYATHVNQEYVIQGNDVILKCGIPSFVADFLTIVSWEDDSGTTYFADNPKTGNLTDRFGEMLVFFFPLSYITRFQGPRGPRVVCDLGQRCIGQM